MPSCWDRISLLAFSFPFCFLTISQSVSTWSCSKFSVFSGLGFLSLWNVDVGAEFSSSFRMMTLLFPPTLSFLALSIESSGRLIDTLFCELFSPASPPPPPPPRLHRRLFHFALEGRFSLFVLLPTFQYSSKVWHGSYVVAFHLGIHIHGCSHYLFYGNHPLFKCIQGVLLQLSFSDVWPHSLHSNLTWSCLLGWLILLHVRLLRCSKGQANHSISTSLFGHIVLLASPKIRRACTDHRGFHPIGIGGEIFLFVEVTRLGYYISQHTFHYWFIIRDAFP